MIPQFHTVKRFLAGAMGVSVLLGSLPVCTAAAAENLLGDVDGDGVITGHDTALISRYLYDDSFSLTAEQLARADITRDGQVTAEDAIWLHANYEQYALGDVALNGKTSFENACLVYQWIYQNNGQIGENALTLTEVQQNLMDTDADGRITALDVQNMLYLFTAEYSFCGKTGCYYLHDMNGSGSSPNGDVDGDGYVTDHDAAILNVFAQTGTEPEEDTAPSFWVRGDVNHDGLYDDQDAALIHQQSLYTYEKPAPERTALQSAQTAMLLNTYQMLGYTVEITKGNPSLSDGLPCRIDDSVRTIRIDTVDYHLLDADADGTVTLEDGRFLLKAYSYRLAGSDFYPAEGCYVLQ